MLLIYLQIALCSFGQRKISDWVELGVINTNGIQSVTLFRVDNKKDTVKIETIKYNSKGNKIEEVEYPSNKFKEKDNIYKTIFVYDNDNLILKESCAINDENKDTIHQNRYNYYYSDEKLVMKTISYFGLDYVEASNYCYNEKGILNQETESYLPASDKISLNDEYYQKRIWRLYYDRYGFLSERKMYIDSACLYSDNYTNDSLGNVLSIEHIGSDISCDIYSRCFLKYNKNNKQILKEELNNCGNAWLTKYIYRKNRIKNIIVSTKYPKIKYKYYRKWRDEPMPPPPIIGPENFQKSYKKYCKYLCFYDSKGKLIKFTENNYHFKERKNYILKYD